VQTGLVVLDREQVVTATIEDGLGNPGLRPHGIDGDERAGERQAFQKERNGCDLIGLGLTCLLPEYEALAAGPCRDQMQRPTVLAAVVSAPRGLAVDGDDLGRGGGRSGLAQVFDPGGEALSEQHAVDGVDDIVEGVMTGNACLEGQQAAEELMMHLAPAPDLHEIFCPRQCAAQHDQQDLRQGKQNLPRLTRVMQRGEVVDKGRANHRGTSSSRGRP